MTIVPAFQFPIEMNRTSECVCLQQTFVGKVQRVTERVSASRRYDGLPVKQQGVVKPELHAASASPVCRVECLQLLRMELCCER